MQHGINFARTVRLAVGTALIMVAALAAAQAQANQSITYQGRLTDGGLPAQGQYDLRFNRYNGPTGGVPLSNPVVVENVPVSNGVFTVVLAFETPFDGDNAGRYLEISVRPGIAEDEVPFTVLGPRQLLTSVPFAINAENAGHLGGIAADQFIQRTGGFSITGNGLIDGNFETTADIQAGNNLIVNNNVNIGGALTIKGPINGTATQAESATNATNAEQLGGVSASQYLRSDGNISVAGNGVIAGNLQVAGNIEALQSLSITHDLTVIGGLNVPGGINATKLGGRPANEYVTTTDNFEINGSGTFINVQTTGDLGVGNDLIVDHNGTISGNLTVAGGITGTVSNATNAAQLGGVAAAQYLRSTGDFNVTGNGAISGNLTVTGAINGTVSNATNAVNATNAANAITATNAYHADNANNAVDSANLGGFAAAEYRRVTGDLNVTGNGAISGNLTVSGAISGTVSNATNAVNATNATHATTATTATNATSADTANNAVNAAKLNGIAANQYVLTNDTRLAPNNFIHNSTTAQTDADFNIGGTGTIGGNANVGGTLNVTGTVNATAVTGNGAGLTGIFNFYSLNGQVNGPIPVPVAGYTFIGHTNTVNLTAGQRLTGSASAPLSISTGTFVATIALCYQIDSGTIRNFAATPNLTNAELNPVYHVASANATVVPGAGSVKFGMCVGNSTQPVLGNSVNGWVMVTNN